MACSKSRSPDCEECAGPIRKALRRQHPLDEILTTGPPLPQIRNANEMVKRAMVSHLINPLIQRLASYGGLEESVKALEEHGPALAKAMVDDLKDPKFLEEARDNNGLWLFATTAPNQEEAVKRFIRLANQVGVDEALKHVPASPENKHLKKAVSAAYKGKYGQSQRADEPLPTLKEADPDGTIAKRLIKSIVEPMTGALNSVGYHDRVVGAVRENSDDLTDTLAERFSDPKFRQFLQAMEERVAKARRKDELRRGYSVEKEVNFGLVAVWDERDRQAAKRFFELTLAEDASGVTYLLNLGMELGDIGKKRGDDKTV